MIRNIKGPINEYIHTKTITLKEWERYFHELYGDIITSQSTEQKQENIYEEGEDIQQQLISKDKIEATMLKMKNRNHIEIIKEVKTAGRGYRMGKHEFKIVCYADDAVVISEDEDNLQKLLHRFETVAGEFNMIISKQKTQSLTIAREPRRCKLAIYDKSVEQVMSFKYLGVNITSKRNLKQEVKTQTTAASRISGFLRTVIWRNKFLSIESKTRIYKTCVRPVMTYAIEMRAETATTKRILRTTEMKTLRSITGKTLRDRIRSNEIRRMCDVPDIVRWARTRRRAWRDHVNRMNNDRLAKIAKEERPNTSRPPGRPPKRWYESWSSQSQLRLPL
ncbi:uncharacterized protein LOC130448413 [Diorhabda sublineata]|uniref:uncharacterized protein LOC130448413 n=1 Tax=Diorhabda sublineata TaxID=1163346 RepID=UPI0024E0F912|nr:uncharacterized protein LOC130448413 [Diorhabda sublineata]